MNTLRSIPPDTPAAWRRLPIRFLSDESGATAIEYGLIAFLILVTIVASMTQVGGLVGKLFNRILNGVSGLA